MVEEDRVGRALLDELRVDPDLATRVRRVQDLTTAAALPDPRAERCRRLAEPDLEFRALDAWQAERYQRGETGQRPGYVDNPFRPH